MQKIQKLTREEQGYMSLEELFNLIKSMVNIVYEYRGFFMLIYDIEAIIFIAFLLRKHFRKNTKTALQHFRIKQLSIELIKRKLMRKDG